MHKKKYSFLEKKKDFYILWDHATGFDQGLRNNYLEKLSGTVYLEYFVNQTIKANYPDIKFCYNSIWRSEFFSKIKHSTNLPKKLSNFVCSFNGSDTIARQFLTSAIYKFEWNRLNYFTKNFKTTQHTVDGNIASFFSNTVDERFYRKFIITDNENFYREISGIDYQQYNHLNNLTVLSPYISDSFVQLIAETEGTRYYPFVTEKFLYAVSNKTLFLVYGQPGYADHLEKYYGFKRYNKIFNYSFDEIINPVIRLVELMTMLSKFEKLSKLDWHDLYLIEQDTIEYNYDWYFSKKYLKELKKYE